MLSTGSTPSTLVGVDVGGTFTDFVVWDGARLHTHKQFTTPQDPGAAILAGLDALGVGAAEIVHGSTVVTNALLERKGARTGLLTTRGFADVLVLGRQNRPHLYRLLQPPEPPLVPRAWRWEVPERLDEQGRILLALDEATVRTLADEVAAAGIESLAIVYLFSFLNPAHERRTRALLQARLPGLPVTLSSDLLPEHREFERSATTVINAYVRPLVDRYLSQLDGRLGDGRRLRVMQSSGGIIGATQAASEAARLALSGPAGGVVGAFRLMQRVAGPGDPELLTLDMGGTSTDVALCPGRILTTAGGEIAGLPIRLPMLDLHTVGAGGGSIARVDAGGALRVGPESAGADPGPACYGRGGMVPTVTDANLLTGRLDPTRFLGGRFRLDVAAARRAVATIGVPLGLEPEAAALGILQVANATMERALRRVSVERGYDPRGFTLVPFGGAGPLHACALAEALGMRRVVIPPQASLLSALGMLLAPVVRERSQALLQPLGTLSIEEVERIVAPLRAAEERAFAAEGVTGTRWEVALDCRYVGQSYELTIPLGSASLAGVAEAFAAAHEQHYGARYPAPVEVVTIRLRGEAAPPLSGGAFGAVPLIPHAATPEGEREVWWAREAPETARTYERDALRPGAHLAGPALVYQPHTTTLVAPGWQGEIDGWGHLVLRASPDTRS